MPLKQSEAIVLRTYPMREADLLVTFFTRAEGKLKGVARSAKKSKRRFGGGALEPLTYVRVYWEDKERQELARIDSCEVLQSPSSHQAKAWLCDSRGSVCTEPRKRSHSPGCRESVPWLRSPGPLTPIDRKSSPARSASSPIAAGMRKSTQSPACSSSESGSGISDRSTWHCVR